MRTLFFTALALLLSLSSLAQPAYSSYDTIPGRYRGYHYTEWYDQCPAFSNGGMIDSGYYEEYVYDRELSHTTHGSVTNWVPSTFTFLKESTTPTQLIPILFVLNFSK